MRYVFIKMGSVSRVRHFGVFAPCLYLISCPNGLSNLPFLLKRLLLWRFNVAGNSEMYLGLHVKCLIFLIDLNQVLSVSTYFHESHQYQISQKFVQWEPP